MVVYRYRTKNGVLSDRVFQMGKAPASITINGQRANRDFSTVNVPSSAGWPMPPCIASGVHPDQANDLRGHFEKSGVSVEVTSEGDPIYTSRKHQDKALACRAMHNKS